MREKHRILFGIESMEGGALKHLVYLCTKLDKEIFEITVVYSDARNENVEIPLEKMRKGGVNLIQLPMCRRIHLLKDLKALLFLLKFIDKKKFDVVHAHSSKAGFLFRIAAYIKRINKVFYTPHCFYFQGAKGVKRYIYSLFEKILVKFTTKIIVSINEYDVAVDNGIVSAPKIEVINNAIYFEEYKIKTQIRQTLAKYKISKKDFVIGSIGRLSPQKDWETYIYVANEILKVYPNTIFLIVGNGELEGELRRLILELGLQSRVILTGYVSDIHNIYGILDIFVSTSLWEGLPYVFLEAMQYNKPIVATNSTNQSSIFDQGDALMCPIKDYRYMAEKIISLIKNKELLKNIGENGRKRLEEKYSFELFVSRHANLYTSK